MFSNQTSCCKLMHSIHCHKASLAGLSAPIAPLCPSMVQDIEELHKMLQGLDCLAWGSRNWFVLQANYCKKAG
jgi:hypothetical protein